MLNKHEVNLTDSEAAAEVARVEKIYFEARLLSAEQVNNEHNCLFFGDQCPCLRQVCRKVLGAPMRCRSDCWVTVSNTALRCAP